MKSLVDNKSCQTAVATCAAVGALAPGGETDHPEFVSTCSVFVAVKVAPPIAVILARYPQAREQAPLATEMLATWFTYADYTMIGDVEVPVHVNAFVIVKVTVPTAPSSKIVPALSVSEEQVKLDENTVTLFSVVP